VNAWPPSSEVWHGLPAQFAVDERIVDGATLDREAAMSMPLRNARQALPTSKLRQVLGSSRPPWTTDAVDGSMKSRQTEVVTSNAILGHQSIISPASVPAG
jgi:hypothetical protein